MLTKEGLVHIYTDNSRELYAFIRRMVGSKETADNILHDVYKKMIILSDKKDLDIANIKFLLFAQAKKSIADNLGKKSQQGKEHSSDTFAYKTEYEFDTTIDDELIIQRMNPVLNKMSLLMKTVFILKKDFLMDFQDIAFICGISEKAVHRCLRSAAVKFVNDFVKAGYIHYSFIYILFYLIIFPLKNIVIT